MTSPPPPIVERLLLLTRRKKRNDATDSELLDMAKKLWHSGDISRVRGNSGEYTLQESVE